MRIRCVLLEGVLAEAPHTVHPLDQVLYHIIRAQLVHQDVINLHAHCINRKGQLRFVLLIVFIEHLPMNQVLHALLKLFAVAVTMHLAGQTLLKDVLARAGTDQR